MIISFWIQKTENMERLVFPGPQQICSEEAQSETQNPPHTPNEAALGTVVLHTNHNLWPQESRNLQRSSRQHQKCTPTIALKISLRHSHERLRREAVRPWGNLNSGQEERPQGLLTLSWANRSACLPMRMCGAQKGSTEPFLPLPWTSGGLKGTWSTRGLSGDLSLWLTGNNLLTSRP